MQNNTFSSLFVGHHLVKLKEVDSTNNYMKWMLSNSKPALEGTVIMAEHQYAGRGQGNNVWKSEKNTNLTISILLLPHFLPVDKQFFLNKAISLGINDALVGLLGDECKIKWPNDIYFRNDKLGGVLIENTLKGNFLKDSIVGIGLNINQREFSSDLVNATSIAKILQEDYNIDKILSQICAGIEKRYLQLKSGNWTKLTQDYKEKLFQRDMECIYKVNNQFVEGIIKDVNEHGYLQLSTSSMGNLELDLKQISFVFNH